MAQWDTGTNDLLAEIDGGVAVLTRNRPERRNALSSAMLGALASALERCEMDSTIGCVVLTGAGGAFCAGGDVKGMAEGADVGPPGAGRDIDSRIHQQRVSQRATSGRLYKMPKPTIAALPGAAAGAGLALALACDLRIAAENAVMTTAFARVGFSGDYGGTYFLSQLVGNAKAREMYFLSERVDMKEAARLGLVNWVVPTDALQAKTIEIARRLAAGPRVAYRYMKENLNRATNGAWDECMDLEGTHHVHCAATDDHKEAARAFVEKREPVFKGR
jgi:2-(1,2-epoxy-1,2-dihydrophenyl)acetyl-CoA isomerase